MPKLAIVIKTPKSSSYSYGSSEDTDDRRRCCSRCTSRSNSSSLIVAICVIVVLVICLLFSLVFIAGLSAIHISAIGYFSFRPAISCAGLPPSSSSGYYWVKDIDGSPVRVYCDTTQWCGGVTGGWMRVAELDMENITHKCPDSLKERRDLPNLRTCVRNEASAGCSSVQLSTDNVRYSTVCGRIIAYQVGTPEQFESEGENNIDTEYLDGVSLTYGNVREHIWSFAVSASENHTCICDDDEGKSPPGFVGQDYFCETGAQYQDTIEGGFTLLSKDPLWDGAGCSSGNTCCSFNSPPWFFKQLPQPTADDIELRVCRDESDVDEDVAIGIVEIYIQ